MSVTITDVETYVVGSPGKPWVFLRLDTDAGVHGIGEATAYTKARTVAAAIEEMRGYFIGASPFDTERLFLEMYRDEWFARNVINTSVISAVDTACWDIKGKLLDQPLYQLLGGRVHDEVRVYANGWYDMYADGPEEVAEAAVGVVEDGYDAMKFDPFGTAWERLPRAGLNRAIDTVRAVREAVGPDVDLLIEGHGRFTPGAAVEVADELAAFAPTWFEEPVPPDNVDGLRQVAARSTIPIATGERAMTKYGVRDILAETDVDIVQPDLANAGGVTEGKKIAAMAEAEHASVAPHNSQGPVMTAVYAHVDVTVPNFMIQETFEDYDVEWKPDLLDTPIRIENGVLDVPDGPGIGVDLDRDALEAHAVTDASGDTRRGNFRGGWEEDLG